ncbi:GNAT family N-acetyltransferase [Zhouia amylolytica]|uniref:GNAT family N-acetyltransferase n=1 Tax=Zhouia amylolytica TaxID=376730 RepID=UPI0023B01872|nr:GNAT family N-acetyltransferase [Zhouia amylolytica]
MIISRAQKNEIDALLKLTKACAAFMQKKGIYQWNESYPSRAAFETDIDHDELYTLKVEGQIAGCIVISTIMDDVYEPITWLTPNDQDHIYIHRLAIHPDLQGRGYAQSLMDYAEGYAIDNGYISIRLDTFSKNLRNQKFYELRGYKRLGEVFFPKQSEHPFYCYEKVLH